MSRIRPGIFQGDDHDHDYDDHDHDHGDDYDDFVCENLGWKHSTGQHKNEEQQLKHCPNSSVIKKYGGNINSYNRTKYGKYAQKNLGKASTTM